MRFGGVKLTQSSMYSEKQMGSEPKHMADKYICCRYEAKNYSTKNQKIIDQKTEN